MKNMKKFTEEDTDEMDMPCPCLKCGGWFDLNDGTGSKKWFPSQVICESCGNKEEKEIEQDEEIEELKQSLENAQWDVDDCTKRLKEIGQPVPVNVNKEKIEGMVKKWENEFKKYLNLELIADNNIDRNIYGEAVQKCSLFLADLNSLLTENK